MHADDSAFEGLDDDYLGARGPPLLEEPKNAFLSPRSKPVFGGGGTEDDRCLPGLEAPLLSTDA